MDRNSFMITLREVEQIIKTSAEPLTKEEILGYFKDMELSEEQKDMVFQYLLTPHEEEEQTDAVQVNKTDDAESDTEQSKVFKMYLDEVSSLPEYSKEEYGIMYINLLRGSKETVKKLSDAWLIKVLEAAEKIVNDKCSIEDVIQEGNIALFMKLTELCGSNLGVDVEQVLTEEIESAMRKYISEEMGASDSENTVAAKANLVKEAKQILSAQGKEPTIYELSEYTKMDIEELADIEEIIRKVKKK